MEKSNEKWRKIIIVIIIVIAIVGGIVYFLNKKVSDRIDEFTAGATLNMTYKVMLTDSATSEMEEGFKLIKKFSLDEGSFIGKTDKKSLYMELIPADSEIELTDCYVLSDEKMINVSAVYDYLLSVVLADHPLISMIIPEWKLGSYITESQMNDIMGWKNADESNDSMQEFQLQDNNFNMNIADIGFYIEDLSATFLLTVLQKDDFEKTEYNDGIIDYSYYRVNKDNVNGRDILIGINPKTLFEDNTQFHIIITDEEMGLQLKLRGDITPEKNNIKTPVDIMSDEEIEVFKTIRATIDAIIEENY